MEGITTSSQSENSDFQSASTAPSTISSPSSPHHGGACFFSAPTSPTRTFNASPDGSGTTSASSTASTSRMPTCCELRPALPKLQDVKSSRDGEDEFEFHITGQLQRTADELFHGGVIKPLKPPRPPNTLTDSIESQSNTKNQIEVLDLSPRNKKYDSVDTTELYVLSPHGLQNTICQGNQNERTEKREKGREKTYDLTALSRKQRGTGSLSQFKVSQSRRKCSNPMPLSKAKESSSKRWNLRDLWVKKSDEQALKKYSVMKKSGGGGGGEDVKESSFGVTESGGGGGVRRRGAASAHERHYTAKKAVAEERRRKTVLPYKHGLMGCMGFNFDPVVHDFSRGIGSLTRG